MRFSLNAKPGTIAILARHGRTRDNSPNRPKVRGWKDEPISKQGKFEVQLHAYKLRQHEPKVIYHSDFMRDSETAHILANELGISDISADYDARTWDTGNLSGMDESEAEPVIREIYRNPYQTAPGGSESMSDFYSRWWEFLQNKLDMASKIEFMRPPLIVTHGRNIATAWSYIKGVPMENGMMPEPAGFAIISVTPNRELEIEIPGEKENILHDV